MLGIIAKLRYNGLHHSPTTRTRRGPPMRVKLQLVMCDDDGQEHHRHRHRHPEEAPTRIEHLGLTLKEAKQLLNIHPATPAATPGRRVSRCLLDLSRLRHATQGESLPDPLVPHPVWHLQARQPTALPLPLPAPQDDVVPPAVPLLTESVAPELLFMETKWASLVSYGMTVNALTDFLPLDVTLDVKTVRHDTLKVAERCEAELGEEQWSFITGCPRDWGNLPIPDGPITVGIDGGYVRDWEAKKHNFEVIVGKSTLAFRRDEEEDLPRASALASCKRWTPNRNGACSRSCSRKGCS